MRKTEFVGALVRLDAELADGTPLKVAVLDDPVAGAAPGSRIALACDPARVTVFREGAP